MYMNFERYNFLSNRVPDRNIESSMFLKMLSKAVIAAALVFTSVTVYAQGDRAPVPNITMTTLDGNDWSLKELTGKVVVLNFWATWCEPCRTEVPYLIKLQRELGSKGLAVAGVTLDEGTDVVKKFVAEYKVDYPILIPSAGSPWTRLENTPTTLLVDREGRLAQKYIGAVPEDDLRRDAERLLAE